MALCPSAPLYGWGALSTFEAFEAGIIPMSRAAAEIDPVSSDALEQLCLSA